MKKAVVVGAGITGLTAGVCLAEAGWYVHIYDIRNHIGGNCHDVLEDTPGSGRRIPVHQYGPHLFHTNDDAVFEFLSRFTEWVPYTHRVKACVHEHPLSLSRNHLLSIPYNLTTERALGRCLTDQEIVELFFRDYSEKMWGEPWEVLPDHITKRVPRRRDNDDTRYFTDKHQCMPAHGYETLFTRMMTRIIMNGGELHLQVGDDEWTEQLPADLVVYTGSIDAFYGAKHGWLPYRSLDIKKAYVPTGRQPIDAAVINECNKKPYTRTTYYAMIHCPELDNTMVPVTIEYPVEWVPGMIRYYPMNWGSTPDLLAKYVAETPWTGCPTVFAGRLGQYQYLNMDQAVKAGMGAVAAYTRE